MSEFQKPYNKVGYLNHRIIFEIMKEKDRKKLKRKVNRVLGCKFYKDV